MTTIADNQNNRLAFGVGKFEGDTCSVWKGTHTYFDDFGSSVTITYEDENEIIIEDYSEHSFVVRGRGTKLYKEVLRLNGGRWNPNLAGGGGWIFSNKRRESVETCFE